MAVRSLGQLTLDLVAKIGGFTRGMTEAERVADQKSRDIARKNRQRAKEVETAWKNATGLIAGAFAGISIANVFQTFIRESIEAQNEQAQLAAVLKSTGQAAGFTAEQLNKMSAELAGRSIFSEGDITKAQTRLLSYTGIVGEQFPEAMQAVIDMAARMGMSVEQSSETIGRALDIPSQGLTALQKQGFRFTEEQKKAVEQLEKTGQVAKAQAIVLDALKLSYGGAAEAARNTLGGAVTALQEQLRSLLTGGDGSLNELTGSINDLTRTLASPEVVQAFNTLGTLIADTIGLLVKGAAAFIEFGKAVGTGLAIRINGPDDPLGVVQEKIRGINAEITSLEGLLNRPKTGLPLSKQELDEINGRLSAARKELEQLRRAEAGVSAGFTPATSVRSSPSGVTAPNAQEIAALASAAKLREERERGAKQAAQQAQSYLDGLRKQLQATEELTTVETVLRDIQAGRVKLAGGVTQQQLLDIAKQIDLAKEMEEIEKQFKKLEEESIERKKRLQDAGKAVYDATRTPAERLNIELARLNDLLKQGAIDWNTYSRAVFEAQDGFDEAMKKGKDVVSEVDAFAKRAAENIQDALGQGLYDIAKGNFDNILTSFTDMITRMIAEAAAADLAKYLFGDLVKGGSGSGVLGEIFKGVAGAFGFGGGRAAGGATLLGQMYRVNENGPEMLEINGSTYLMMGNKSGNVVPSGGMNVVNNFSVSGPVDRRTEAQIGKAASRGLQRAQRWM